mmetsp:Transcript_24457/g.51228  ORF Transcript_24457/g.51228 Transcript_24457/m.51228 type:complete len:398 (-) Transcript_24457:403-1596(-)
MTIRNESGVKRKRLSTIKSMLDQGLSTHRRTGANDVGLGKKPSRKKKKMKPPMNNANKELSPPAERNVYNRASITHRQKQQKKKKSGQMSIKGDDASVTQQQHQSSKDDVITNDSGKKTGKKKKKKINTKPPRQRIVCIAEETLIQCIDRKRLLGGDSMQQHADDNLSDLPKDLINSLPDVPYKKSKKPVVVVSDSASSDRAVAEIRAELSSDHKQYRNQRKNNSQQQGNPSFSYLGFDTETRPKFHQGGDPHPPALIQLATQTTAYLFRLTFQGANHKTSEGMTMTKSLQNLLCDLNIIKVGIGIHKDVEDLKHAYGADCCGDGTSYLDLAPVVNLRWPKIKRAGLRNLTATVLRRKLSKAQQMKNWEMKRLTPAMEAYAAADAWVSLDLLAAIVG